MYICSILSEHFLETKRRKSKTNSEFTDSNKNKLLPNKCQYSSSTSSISSMSSCFSQNEQHTTSTPDETNKIPALNQVDSSNKCLNCNLIMRHNVEYQENVCGCNLNDLCNHNLEQFGNMNQIKSNQLKSRITTTESQIKTKQTDSLPVNKRLDKHFDSDKILDKMLFNNVENSEVNI